MTHTPARQPQYIITEAQLRQIELDDYPEIVCQQVREATHTSPPAPEHGRWRDAENPEMVHTPQQHTECYLDGYADGAKAAREQVLDELLLWCNDNWHGAFIVQYEKQLTEQVVDLVRLKAMIKSLRAP